MKTFFFREHPNFEPVLKTSNSNTETVVSEFDTKENLFLKFWIPSLVTTNWLGKLKNPWFEFKKENTHSIYSLKIYKNKRLKIYKNKLQK